MKKKKLFLTLNLFAILLLSMYVITVFNLSSKDNKGDGMTAVLIENDAGNYVASSDPAFPKDGYTMNLTKSYCKDSNGTILDGYLSYDETTKTVSVIGASAVKCTLYYDKIPDLKISTLIVDGTSSTTFPNTNLYTPSLTCSSGTASWDNKSWGINISSPATCSLSMTTKNKEYLNAHITGLSGTVQGKNKDNQDDASYGQIVNENGYRYEGTDPLNYVWYNNEYWRIIGVFDVLLADGTTKSVTKIIKNDMLGSYVFDNSTDISSYGSNAWVRTNGIKSDINILLNDYYYKALDGTGSGSCYGYRTTITSNCNWTKTGIQEKYRNMVANATWYLGGYSSMGTPNAWYGYERGTTTYSGNATSTTGYIGLMYPSDYGYSVLSSSCARTTSLGSYSTKFCAGSNWLFKYNYEWTLSPHSSNALNVWSVSSTGSVSYYHAYSGYVIRPTLYLNSSVYIISGEGSYDNPYILDM